MNVLGLDTCFGALSVAVGQDLGRPSARVLARTEAMSTGHAERLMPLVGTLLVESGLSMPALDRIAVTVGPGSFTGSRIAIAAARALSLSLGTPIVTFSSLEAIALHSGLAPEAGEDVLVVMDARRGEVYVQLFNGATRAPLTAPGIAAEADVAALGQGRRLLVCGSAAAAICKVLQNAAQPARQHDGTIWPDMAAALIPAMTRAPSSVPAEPLYLRPPDAKPQEGKSLPRAVP